MFEESNFLLVMSDFNQIWSVIYSPQEFPPSTDYQSALQLTIIDLVLQLITLQSSFKLNEFFRYSLPYIVGCVFVVMH